eukprot:5721362-Pyramimonas_sp.AAC.1
MATNPPSCCEARPTIILTPAVGRSFQQAFSNARALRSVIQGSRDFLPGERPLRSASRMV